MARWLLAVSVVLLSCVPFLTTDWQNLSFPMGGVTSVLAVLMLFWFVRELSDSLPLATACASLFALWIAEWGELFSPLAYTAAAVCLLLGVWRHRFNVIAYLPGALLFVFVGIAVQSIEVGDEPAEPFQMRAVWMTVLALASLATYSRYERLHSKARAPEITATTLPATRTSVQPPPSKPPAWMWPLLSFGAFAGALMADREAIALPVCLLLIGLSFRWRGHRPRWWLAISTGLTALGFFVANRGLFVGRGDYEMGVATVTFLLLGYSLFPTLPVVWSLADAHAPLAALSLGVVRQIGYVIANVAAYMDARDEVALGLTALLMSTVAYLPVAILTPSERYPLLASAVRTVFVMTFVVLAFRRLVTAASPREMRAPKRLSPAPGSLPRP